MPKNKPTSHKDEIEVLAEFSDEELKELGETEEFIKWLRKYYGYC